MLNAYWGTAAPLITRRFGGEVEKFIGDGIVATFNSRGDQPDHAVPLRVPRSRCSDEWAHSPTSIPAGRGCGSA